MQSNGNHLLSFVRPLFFFLTKVMTTLVCRVMLGSLILPYVSVACIPHMLLSRVVNRGPSGSSALQSSQISSLIRTFSLVVGLGFLLCEKCNLKQSRTVSERSTIEFLSVSPSPRRYDLRRLH